ncbi:MAG: DUF3551 domain-containing protein [Xanthobacteraceae bacterium]
MKRLPSTLVVLAGITLAALAIASSAQAQNYPWCAQYTGHMGGAMNCGFVSFDQCMATARGMGAFCIQNNTYRAPAGRRPARWVAPHHVHHSS